MSCSKITEKADEEQEDEESDDTLVVVVKPDGTVAIDQDTFNRVLESNKETMNIIHFENSSNKGITSNPESGEPEINLTVQGFYPSISTQAFLSQVTSYGGELNPSLLDLSAEQLEQLESSLSRDIFKIFGQDESNILGILPNEKSDISKNPIYLDHCYYKDCPPNSSSNRTNTSFKNTLSSGMQHITSKLTQSQIKNEIEEIEEITVSVDESQLNVDPSLVEDIKSSATTTSFNVQTNPKKMLNLRVGKNEKSKTRNSVFLRNVIPNKKIDEIQSNHQSNDIPRTAKTVKRLVPMKSHRPTVQIKTNRQKKSDVAIDQVLLQANELVRQSSIEPKKYIQNQLMFKKNKDKIGNIENALEPLATTQKQVKQLLDVPELFSSPDIIIDDNKVSIKTELNSETCGVEKVDNEIVDYSLADISKDTEQLTENKEEIVRVRKISNKVRSNPAEITVTKTVEDILNDISSKIANQTEIIDEENLIDELADLNEDLNSSNFVAPSNSSHDLMNKLLSDDNLNQHDKNDLKTPPSDDRLKGSTVVYGKSGRIVTLPPIETPKTRSLVKKENADASIKDQVRQRRSSENSKSINEYSEESDTDKEGTMTSEDDPNRLWCICRKPHNNRFMICCDTCEDWFHGKCVGITKALGEQMEARGVEWNCPPCRKKKTEEARKKLEEDKTNKKVEEEKKKRPSSKTSPLKKTDSKVTKIQPQSLQNCVQCKKDIDGMAVSLFCNETCLDKHIEESVTAIKACCTSESPEFILCDKKNSRLITGEQAPKLSNLKQWMKENPSFQILKPGPSKASSSKISSKSQSNPKLIQSTLKLVKKENENRLKRRATSPDKQKTKDIKREFDVSELLQPDKVKLVFVKKEQSKSLLPQKELIKHTSQKESTKQITPQKEPIKQATLQKESLKSVPPVSPIKLGTPTPTKVAPVQKIVKKKPEPVKKPDTVKKPEPPKKPEPVKEIVNEIKGEEQLRSNVRKSLLESLSSRISEEPELKTAEENLEELISKIEEELYIQFGKVDQKYKTKYRSLVFNIKDPKNLNFFKKIMFKWVTPYQLVRMTADEMASQELAEWRERENKHQIEMIRKTELDMMNQSKALLMKTHKGEEIIESKDNKETIVSELNPDIKVAEKKPQLLLKVTKEDKKEKKKSKYKERSNSGDRERRHHKSSRNRHKSHKDKKRRSRDRSKSRDKKDKKVDKNKKIEIRTEQVSDNQEVRKEDDISDREPSSTVVIATPPRTEEEISPIWKGTINFTDVARCNVTMSRLSGNIAGLDEELTLTVLECVGRIKQHTVWEYMGKLKKSGTKDIIVTKLSAGGIEQQMSYLSLYQYLSAKNRIAVIDSKPFPNIKDFYVYPLGSHSPIPQVLLPLDGPGVDDYRTHLLLGIIVRNSKKHWIPSWKPSENNYILPDINDTLALPHLKPSLPASSQDGFSPKESYTPPRSPTNRILSLPTPVLPLTSVLTDDDLPYVPGEEEPYSPVDEDVPSLSDEIHTTSSIHQQMEELTRKIEKEKLVIQMMTASSQNVINDVDSLDLDDEVYSPTSELAPLTTDIQLPSNIKDILSSINTKELQSIEVEATKTATDIEKKCRDPRQRIPTIASAEPPPPGLEDEFPPPCNPDTSLPPPNFTTPYMPPINYIAPIPYPYPPPGYIPDTYPNQYGPQPPPPPPPPMVMDQGTYNNYNQPGYAYNSVQYQQPPPPPPYSKTKKGSGFWASGNSKNEPKKKKFKKSGDRRDKGNWRRM